MWAGGGTGEGEGNEVGVRQYHVSRDPRQLAASYRALDWAKSISWCLSSSSGDMPVSFILRDLVSRSLVMALWL